MTTVPNLRAELSHMAEWVATQVQCGLCPATVAQHQYDTLLMKINNLPQITTDEATSLVKTIRDCSLNTWPKENIARLCQSVGVKTGMLSMPGGSKQWQDISIASTVFTASEIKSLKSGDLSEKACTRLVAARCKAIGAHTLSENSKGKMAALVAWGCGKQQGADWLRLLGDVKSAISKAITSKSWAALGYSTVWDFDRIADMSAEPWWAAAYKDEGPSLEDIQTDEPDYVRRSSKRWTTKTTPTSAVPPMIAPDPTAGGQLQIMQAMFGAPLAAALFANSAAAALKPPEPPAQPRVELEPPKPKLPPREEPQPDKAAVPPQPDKAVVPPEEADLSDEEAKLRKLLSTKAKVAAAARKRPAAVTEGVGDAEGECETASVTPKGKTTAMKKAKPPAMRRPAAAVPKKPAVLPKPPTSERSTPYRCGYVIYKPSHKLFRAVVGRADRRFRFDNGATRTEAWREALAWIDAKC